MNFVIPLFVAIKNLPVDVKFKYQEWLNSNIFSKVGWLIHQFKSIEPKPSSTKSTETENTFFLKKNLIRVLTKEKP